MKSKLKKFVITVCGVLTGIVLCGSSACNAKSSRKTEENSEKVVRLRCVPGGLTVSQGVLIKYSHAVHGSVGITYRMEYNKDAFEMSCDTEYSNPQAVRQHMCGADRGVATCTLKAMKKGTYTIKVIHEFRGEVENTETYTVNVI